MIFGCNWGIILPTFTHGEPQQDCSISYCLSDVKARPLRRYPSHGLLSNFRWYEQHVLIHALSPPPCFCVWQTSRLEYTPPMTSISKQWESALTTMCPYSHGKSHWTTRLRHEPEKGKHSQWKAACRYGNVGGSLGIDSKDVIFWNINYIIRSLLANNLSAVVERLLHDIMRPPFYTVPSDVESVL